MGSLGTDQVVLRGQEEQHHAVVRKVRSQPDHNPVSVPGCIPGIHVHKEVLPVEEDRRGSPCTCEEVVPCWAGHDMAGQGLESPWENLLRWDRYHR